MQQPANNRKRPQPGAAPMAQQAPFQYQQMADNPDLSNWDFGTFAPAPGEQTYPNQAFPDSTFTDADQLSAALNQAQPPSFGANYASNPSTELVRLPKNQRLAPPQGGQQEQWNPFGGMDGQEEETEQELENKVALAKRDAQGKRKQIPPFVQKLSSFLDSNNTDLIRWSDDGRSFIVLDEDEFARTLIPELFKHNNYASFVRQLNMYGFHKTVNITDGSLRQSEKARKGVKPPSMYSHPYFRKNRPDLLWLIQKPVPKPSTKRKREGDGRDGYGSDEERQYSPVVDGQPVGNGGGLTTIPRNELASVRSELKRLQQQQNLISRLIAQLKEQNDRYYRQATAFQAQHDRHENSINAILTFLATFYNRSLDGHAGQNLVNMFGNVQKSNQQQSGVVEEFNDGTPEASNRQVQRYYKRPQLLLTGPERSAVTEPNSARASASPPARENSVGTRPQTAASSKATSPVVKNDAPTPNNPNVAPESDQMMSLINSVNATNASTPSTSAPTFDFNSALDHYQNADGQAPLTPQQRDDMLAMIASHHGGDASDNNALISPNPPAMPDLNQLKQTQQHLEMLTSMQKRQDEKVQELNRRLQPLSPTGSIPGLHTDETNPFDVTGAPGDFDPSTYLNLDYSNGEDGNGNYDFGGGFDHNTGNDDFDWNFGADNNGATMFQNDPSTNELLGPQDTTTGRVESVSSGAPSPNEGAEAAETDSGTPTTKRQRLG